MRSDTRGVTLFIATGLVSAAGVGFGVWRISAPAAPSFSDTATAQVDESTAARHTPRQAETTRRSTGVLPTGTTEPAVPVPTPTLSPDGGGKVDPYLAPHAVVHPAPTSVPPTVVYRPDNVVPTPLAVTTAPAAPAEEPTVTAVPAETAETTESEVPEVPEAPAEPDASGTTPDETPPPGFWLFGQWFPLAS